MEVGTLEQIGAKVGDTVIDDGDGMIFRIDRIVGDLAEGITIEDGTEYGDTWHMSGLDSWRIHTSAATDNPTTPETGTLEELQVKAGDVVENNYSRDQYEVKVNASGDLANWNIKDGLWGVAVKDSWQDYRIVSRAAKGPVITETVTRKRIVAGVYGKVSVLQSNGWWFALTDKGDGVPHVEMSRADLIAARDVFNQLIDALGA